MRFLILGYGKFGRLATNRVKEAFPDANIVVVDTDEDVLRHAPPGADLLRMDALEAVDRLKGEPDCVVVPMVPFHVAASYLLRNRTDVECAAFPGHLVQILPNPFVVDESSVACSKAGFLCPDDCPEGELCTVTGLFREPLYGEVEGALAAPAFVIVSRQILPGIGGYPHEKLTELTRQPLPETFFVATTCKCHGFVTAFRRKP